MLAIGILSSLYTGAQIFRQIHELSTGKQLIKPSLATIIDFFGDQVCHVIHFYMVLHFCNMTMILRIVRVSLNFLKINALVRLKSVQIVIKWLSFCLVAVFECCNVFLVLQIMAYFLISSASSAIPMTNRMREGADNIFTDASSTAISMSIFAFLCLAASALISGYKLSAQSYIWNYNKILHIL